MSVLLLVTAGLGIWYAFHRNSDEGPRIAHFAQATFAGSVRSAALSPDGRTVAFAPAEQSGNPSVFLHDVRRGQARQIRTGFYAD